MNSNIQMLWETFNEETFQAFTIFAENAFTIENEMLNEKDKKDLDALKMTFKNIKHHLNLIWIKLQVC